MKEFRQPVHHYKVWAYCDCGGEMCHTGQCLTSNPPQYPHICNICKKVENFRVIYPHIEYKVDQEYFHSV